MVISQATCRNADAGSREAPAAEVPIKVHTVFLRVRVGSDAVARFSYSIDGVRFTGIGEAFTVRPGKWIGAKLGLFAIGNAAAREYGYADFDWFHLEPWDINQ